MLKELEKFYGIHNLYLKYLGIKDKNFSITKIQTIFSLMCKPSTMMIWLMKQVKTHFIKKQFNYVQKYLKTGEGTKMFQEIKYGFLRHEMGWVIPIQMFISINFMDLSQIGFFVFFQKMKTTSQFNGYLIVNEDNNIETVSYEILEKVGLNQFPTNQTIQNFSMDEVMSEYDRILGEILVLDNIDSCEYQNIQINLPTINYFQHLAEINDRSISQSLYSLRSQRSSKRNSAFHMVEISGLNESQNMLKSERQDNVLNSNYEKDDFSINVNDKLQSTQLQQNTIKSERNFFDRLNSKDTGQDEQQQLNQNAKPFLLKSIFSKKNKSKQNLLNKKLTIKQPTIDQDRDLKKEKNSKNKKKQQEPKEERDEQETSTALQFKDELYKFDDAPSLIENEISIIQHVKELDQNKFNKVNHNSHQFCQNILDDLNTSFLPQNPYRNLDDIDSLQQSERNSLFSKRDQINKNNTNTIIDISQISVIQKQESEATSFLKQGNDQSIAISLQLLESYTPKAKTNIQKKNIQKKKGFELEKIKSQIDFDFDKGSSILKRQYKGSDQVPILKFDEELPSNRIDKSFSMLEIKYDYSIDEKTENKNINKDIAEGIKVDDQNNCSIDNYKVVIGQDSTVMIKEESESQINSKTQITHRSQKSIKSIRSIKSIKTNKQSKNDSQRMKYSSNYKNQALDMSASKRKSIQNLAFVNSFQQKQHTIETISHEKEKDQKNNDTLFNQENNAILPEVKQEPQVDKKKSSKFESIISINNQEQINHDQQSVTSSLQKSIFSNKYDNFHKFLQLNNPPDLNKLRILKGIEFLLVVSITLWANLVFYISFSDYQDQLQVINFRSSTLSPISISLSMVYQQLKNQDLLSKGYISQAEYNSASSLVFHYITEGYNTFINQFDENLSYDYTRETYTSHDISITGFSSTNKKEIPLILSSIFYKTLLMSFNITAENTQTSQNANFDSISLKFAFDNYSPLFDFFSQLSTDLKNDIKNTIEEVQVIFILQLVGIFLSYIVMQTFQFYYYRKFMQLVKLTLRVFESSTLIQIESEVVRLTKIQSITDGESSNLIFCYDFDLRAKEISLRSESKKIQQDQDLMNVSQQRYKSHKESKNKYKKDFQKRTQRNFRIDSDYVSYKSFFILLAINSIPFFAYIAVSLSLILTYTSDISDVISTYHRFSDAQSYIQSSQILKYQIINFVPSSDQKIDSENQVVRSFIESVNEADNFSSSSIDQYIQTLQLVDYDLQNQINLLISQNACNDTSTFSDNLTANLLSNLQNRCELSLSGQLQLGTKAYLSNFLQKMKNLINLNFQSSLQQDQNTDEAIISVISTKIIQKCSNKIHDKLVEETAFNKIVIFTFGFLFLAIMLFTLCYYIVHENTKLIKQFQQAQFVIFLLPSITLLTDDTFFKQISYLNIKLQES